MSASERAAESPLAIRLPFPLSVVNQIGDPLRKQLVRVDLAAAMRTAERVTGLGDFGDGGGFGRRLAATMASVEQIDWNLIGRFALRHSFHWNLINRLNLVDLRKRRPDLQQMPVEKPIIILGLFRTGTTFLHNVMAADPDSRAGTTWELAYPAGRARDPLGDEKWRRRRASIPTVMNHVVVPDQDVVHYVTLDAFEEDFFLLENDMAMLKFVVGFGDWQYGWRMLDWDLRESYQFHRLQLQFLSAQRNAQRWLLKSPWHLWNLEALLNAYPDARIIHIHRDVAQAIGSQCSLNARICCRVQRKVNLEELGRFWLDYSLVGMERGLAARERLPASQVYDVHLHRLREAPGTVLQEIYEHFDLPLNGALLQRFEQVAAEESAFQLGVHDYRLEDFGLRAASVRGAFSDYRARFSLD